MDHTVYRRHVPAPVSAGYPRELLDCVCALVSGLLEQLQSVGHGRWGSASRKHDGKRRGVLYRLGGALSLVYPVGQYWSHLVFEASLSLLTRCKGMCGVADEGHVARAPGRQLLHVHEPPHLDRGRINLADKRLQSWVEVLEDFEKLRYGALLVPFCGSVSALLSEAPSDYGGSPTFAFGGVGLGVRVDAHEVEHLVVVARVHDDPLVRAEPHEKRVIPVH